MRSTLPLSAYEMSFFILNNNALKLYKPQHEIIWSLDELDKLIQEIETILKTKPNNQLKDKLLDCYREFMEYSKKLSDEGL